jgi:serine/threonine protein kinase
MSLAPSCPECGKQLPPNAPAGLCPRCLLRAGLESPSDVDPAERPTQPPSPDAPPGTAVSPPGSGPASALRVGPPTPEELAPRFPHLQILELLGQGGMGIVYKARQPGLDRLVAVKILPQEASHDPTFAERFTREARALGKLNHPNIVALYDFGQVDGLYYFVME